MYFDLFYVDVDCDDGDFFVFVLFGGGLGWIVVCVFVWIGVVVCIVWCCYFFGGRCDV